MSTDYAKRLRANQTEAENRLWYLLRDRRFQGFRFRRQHPIGKFIVDFACTKHRLIIEADGGQHADNPADATRTAYLESKGWQVVRFWNNDILANTDGVMRVLLDVLEKSERDSAEVTIPSPVSRQEARATLSRGAGEGIIKSPLERRPKKTILRASLWLTPHIPFEVIEHEDFPALSKPSVSRSFHSGDGVPRLCP